MSGTGILLTSMVVVRLAGSAMRAPARPMPLKVVGWVLCAVALWLGAGACGAWFPLWTVLVPSVGGGLVAMRWDGWQARAGVDLAVIALGWVFSLTLVSPLAWAVIGLGAASLPLAVDRWIANVLARKISPWVSSLYTAVLVVLCAIVVVEPLETSLSTPYKAARELMSAVPSLPFLTLTVRSRGQRVELPTGTVAWLDRPPGRRAVAGAILFHGNDPQGSSQRAACALRRSLLYAGFAVLSVDHPGYGESPVPATQLESSSWDPLPSDQAALEFMRQRGDVQSIFLIGHSMGCSDALRLLAAGADVQAAVLFGAGLPDSLSHEGYWYERFHRDRGLSQELPAELVSAIRADYYDNKRLALALPPDHAPVHFVRFTHEHENLRMTRDELLKTIPEPKTAWDLTTGHYFNTWDFGHLLIADTRATRSCASLLRGIVISEARQEVAAESKTLDADSRLGAIR